MLRAKGLSPSQYKYYLEHLQNDKLKNIQNTVELDGVWLGKGADHFGLSGHLVKRSQIKNLFEGYYPRNKQIKLVVNAGYENRNAAWDFTFAAPKPVSVLAALLYGTKEHEIILETDFQAVENTINYLSKFVHVRSVKRNDDPKLVYAAFQHLTSRMNDPHLHIHCCLINVCILPDGSTGAIDASPLFKLQFLGSALYRAELAYRLEQRLGLSIISKKAYFDIEGFPKNVVDNFSKRQWDILDEINQRLQKGHYNNQIARYATRKEKEHFTVSELYRTWASEAKKLLFTEQSIRGLFGRSKKRDEDTQNAEIQDLIFAVGERLKKLNRNFSSFTVLQYIAEEAQGRGISAQQAIGIAKGYMQTDDLILKKQYQNMAVYQKNTDIEVDKNIKVNTQTEQKKEQPKETMQPGKLINLTNEEETHKETQEPKLRLVM